MGNLPGPQIFFIRSNPAFLVSRPGLFMQFDFSHSGQSESLFNYILIRTGTHQIESYYSLPSMEIIPERTFTFQPSRQPLSIFLQEGSYHFFNSATARATAASNFAFATSARLIAQLLKYIPRGNPMTAAPATSETIIVINSVHISSTSSPPHSSLTRILQFPWSTSTLRV